MGRKVFLCMSVGVGGGEGKGEGVGEGEGEGEKFSKEVVEDLQGEQAVQQVGRGQEKRLKERL